MTGHVISLPSGHVTRCSRLVFGIALCLYLETAGGSLATTDAVATFEVTRNVIERGSFAMSGNVLGSEAHRGVDGRYYAPFGVAHVVYKVPFVLTARLFKEVCGISIGKPDSLEKAAFALGSTVAAAGAVWATFLFAVRLTMSIKAAAASALTLGFATLLWPYSKFGFNAPLATLSLLGSAYSVWVGARSRQEGRIVAGGVFLGFGLLTRHELALAALPFNLWLAMESWDDKRLLLRRIARLSVPVLVALAIWAIYNHLRFGNLLDTGYLREPVSFSGSILGGLHGLFLAPGASLFLYSPIVVFGACALVTLAWVDRSTALLFGTLILTFVLFYASLEHWDGGRSYGTRYLVPLLPFFCLPLAFWFRGMRSRLLRRALFVLCVVSLLVQLPGTLMDFSKVRVAHASSAGRYSSPDSRYSWRAAGLVLNTRAAMAALPRNTTYLLGLEIPPQFETKAPAERRDFAQQFAFSLDLWWVYLFYFGLANAPVAVFCGVVPICLTFVLVQRLRRHLGSAILR